MRWSNFDNDTVLEMADSLGITLPPELDLIETHYCIHTHRVPFVPFHAFYENFKVMMC